jgi:DNA-binding transcriptional ArsR family regulator
VGEVLDNAPEDLTPAELLVFISVAEDARDKDRLAQYSDVEHIAHRTRLKPGTIRNALSTLTNAGLLIPTLERVYRGGKHQEYKVPKLHPHHRNVSLHNDMTTSPPSDMPRHSPMTLRAVDNP